MSLQIAVAVPFRQQGARELGEGEFVVALSLDREWFSPDQAKRLVDVAVGRGLLENTDGELRPTFDVGDVEIPEGFTPDTEILREQSTFEQLLDLMVSGGLSKQEAVAETNETQRRLGISLEAAAIVVSRRHGIDCSSVLESVQSELEAS